MPVWLIVLLVVLALVVVLVGTLGVLAWVGVKKYIGAAKQSEALLYVGEISRDAVSTYGREASDGTGPVNRLCDSASHPVPASIASVTGKKYPSQSAEWTVDAATPDKGFACLAFEISAPQYYQYDYRRDAKLAFTAEAQGDLDGNGVTSKFTQHGTVVSGAVVLDPTITRSHPEE